MNSTQSEPIAPPAQPSAPITKIVIPGMPGGCCGEFQIDADGHGLFRVGYFLHIRSPKNTLSVPMGEERRRFPSEFAAKIWLVDEVAGPFFSDHKAAATAIAKWRASLVAEDSGPESDGATAGPLPGSDEESAVAAPAQLAATSAGPIATKYLPLPLAEIAPNPQNARRTFDEGRLLELAHSIAAQGFLLQPIAVRDLGADAVPRYRLISGERRWRAFGLLNGGHVPSLDSRGKWDRIEAKVFVGVDDARAGELHLIENLQREELNAIEEAEGFSELVNSYRYSPELIAERTGKAVSTIKHALRLLWLPESVREMVRAGALPADHAKALAGPRWSIRPDHCRAAADWAVQTSATRDKLRQNPPVSELLEWLAAADLAVDVTAYRAHIPGADGNEPGSDIVATHDGRLWHLSPRQWDQEKAEIDRQEEEKRQREAARAVKRVENAKAAAVNVKVEDLARAGLDYTPLTGLAARYADHLPDEMKAVGIGEDGAELLVCLRPEELKKLRRREAELIEADTAAKLPALIERASATIRRTKRITGRELAAVIAAAQAGTVLLDGLAWDRQAVPVPADIGRDELATVDPVDLVRVVLESTLQNTKGGELYGTLRWVLQTDDLGLAEESEALRDRLLAAAATEVFPAVTLDPVRLKEWVRAAELGMPIAEIARSYKVSEADVRGALEGAGR